MLQLRWRAVTVFPWTGQKTPAESLTCRSVDGIPANTRLGAHGRIGPIQIILVLPKAKVERQQITHRQLDQSAAVITSSRTCTRGGGIALVFREWSGSTALRSTRGGTVPRPSFAGHVIALKRAM